MSCQEGPVHRVFFVRLFMKMHEDLAEKEARGFMDEQREIIWRKGSDRRIHF